MKAFLLSVVLLAGCANRVPQNPDPVKPVIVVPSKPKPRMLKLWSTYYYAPVYKSTKSGYPLRDIKGKSLGVNLPLKALCNLMLQGSGFIDGKIYGWGGVNYLKVVDCSKYYSKKNVSGRLKFKRDTSIRGVKNYKITPFKSIAVDEKVIPYGSKVCIPSFKGVRYTDDDGKKKTHDGNVIAQDTGGAIIGNHIDFYVGKAVGPIGSAAVKVRPFKSVKSTSSGTFEAYIGVCK